MERQREYFVNRRHASAVAVCCFVALVCGFCQATVAQDSLQVEQITRGPKHHFFGYIGQSKMIPWNASGRYVLALETDFHDRMPEADEEAVIGIIDTENAYTLIPLTTTRAWNFQQGTMFYWHPRAAETQFFFNERDPETNKIYTVLYDIDQGERIREYLFAERPVANGGVAPDDTAFAAINYGRMARARPVTGYPGAYDWNTDTRAPVDDGVFLVDTATGELRLLISFSDMAAAVRDENPQIDEAILYINHTLWNRDSDTLYFFLRGRIGTREIAVNIPCTIRRDGTGFTAHETFIGGHPEWGEGDEIIGRQRSHQVVYNVRMQEIVRRIGSRHQLPDPEGDIALSPDGQWLVNGSKYRGDYLRYDFIHLPTGRHLRSPALDRGGLLRGALRIDPAPRWNRTSDAILVPGWTKDGTRQLHVIRMVDG